MTAAESNTTDLNRHAFLARLQTADTALRAGMGQDCIERLARAHVERALAHIREAETALHNLARARTVTDLAEQLARNIVGGLLQADGEQKRPLFEP